MIVYNYWRTFSGYEAKFCLKFHSLIVNMIEFQPVYALDLQTPYK